MTLANSLIVLDFETTGLSPDMGDRAIEIGAVKIENGQLTERFQSLMNPGQRVSSFIESYTGISNSMLSTAPNCADVMSDFADFIGDSPLLAHNASFDRRFLEAEFNRINRTLGNDFLCSLLIARRVLPEAPNHKLGTLIDFCHIESDGQFHRALYDSEMTAKLWLAILDHIETHYGVSPISLTAMQKIAKLAKKKIPDYLLSLTPCE